MKSVFLALVLAVTPAWAADKSPSEYYSVENIATPPGLSAEVGGLAVRPDGKLVACFHRGEVYTYDPETKEWKLFAQGLHDPLGVLAPKNDEIIVMQRPELTRLRDTDGDGVADRYETICDAFGLTGNYHEFAFGPLPAPDGGWFVALNTASNGSGVRHEVRGEYRQRGRNGRMYAAVPWRGWVAKISPDGKLTPWASGFRSPNTLGYDAAGRLFAPDNQGDWIGTSPLYHIEKGKFYGHPAALAWQPGETRDPLDIPATELDEMRTRAAVLFPHNILANSATQPLADLTDGKFGPFAGQMLVGEMNRARIVRVALEEVDGQLQGMAVPLLDDHGLNKGNNRFVFAPDGSLWVGQTDHGWAGDQGIQRIRWTGKTPLDVLEMHLTKTGFDLTFTRPLDPATASAAAAFNAKRYYYEYHAAYGSPQFELEQIEPKAVTISEDRTKVTLEFDPLLAWRVYEFDLQSLKAEDGAAISNPLVVYTLNHLLEGTPPPPAPGPGAKPQNEPPKKVAEEKPAEKLKPASGVPEPEEKPAIPQPPEPAPEMKLEATPPNPESKAAPEPAPPEKKPDELMPPKTAEPAAPGTPSPAEEPKPAAPMPAPAAPPAETPAPSETPAPAAPEPAPKPAETPKPPVKKAAVKLTEKKPAEGKTAEKKSTPKPAAKSAATPAPKIVATPVPTPTPTPSSTRKKPAAIPGAKR